MIKNLLIENFKSIKKLEIECSRVNLFIGDPNVGKSNILEALSFPAIQLVFYIDKLMRCNDLSNLFYENDLSNSIIVNLDELKSKMTYEKGNVKLDFSSPNLSREMSSSLRDKEFRNGVHWSFKVHPYFFKSLRNFPELDHDYLSVPNGDNLFLMLQTNKDLRKKINRLIGDVGFKLALRQSTHEVEIFKEEEGAVITYPYSIISDTLQRLIFFISAIETNKPGSTLILEEPESNVFPYYTKFLAEKIAYDSEKQYFITTHNPYFLQSIIEKTPTVDLKVNLVKMQDFQTKVISLSERGKEEILDLNSDVFLNFDKLLEA